MALKLSSAAIAAANKVDSDSAWLILLEINLPNADDPIRLVRNTDNIEWNGVLWQAFPFSISETKQDDKGTLPTLNVNVDNTTRDLEYYLQNGGGGAGANVILRVVRSDSMDYEADFEEHYTVKNTSVTANAVTFTLGNAYPIKARRPWERYMKNTCPFKYKGLKCGATSALEGCNHTLTDCRARGNSERFGGFTGIPQGGLYV